MNEDEVKFRGTIAFTAEILRASYEVTNQSAEDLYVFDVKFRPKGERALDPAFVYTVLEGDLLTLFRGVLRIPYGVQVEMPDVPYARLLRSGETLRSYVETTVPLPFNHPYAPHEKRETISSGRVQLRIGYVAAKDVNPPPPGTTVGPGEVYFIRYRQAIETQHFLETPVQDGAVQVLVSF